MFVNLNCAPPPPSATGDIGNIEKVSANIDGDFTTHAIDNKKLRLHIIILCRHVVSDARYCLYSHLFFFFFFIL